MNPTGQYSDILIYSIKKMLTWDEKRRPTFKMIQ